MADEVLTERRGKVRLITLNRPESRNAVNTELAEGAVGPAEEPDGDPEPAWRWRRRSPAIRSPPKSPPSTAWSPASPSRAKRSTPRSPWPDGSPGTPPSPSPPPSASSGTARAAPRRTSGNGSGPTSPPSSAPTTPGKGPGPSPKNGRPSGRAGERHHDGADRGDAGPRRLEAPSPHLPGAARCPAAPAAGIIPVGSRLRPGRPLQRTGPDGGGH